MSSTPSNRLTLSVVFVAVCVAIVAISTLRQGEQEHQSSHDEKKMRVVAVDQDTHPAMSAARASATESERPAELRPAPLEPESAAPAPSLSISGRVVDAVGRPQINWIVQLANTRRAVFESTFATPRLHTDGDGQFKIGGLADQSFILSAIHPEFALRVDSGAIRAGSTGIEIVLADAQFIPRVHGRVVKRDDTPRAGLQLVVQVTASLGDSTTTTLTGLRTKSNDKGEFDLRDVPRAGSVLLVQGDGVMPIALPIADLDATREIRIEVDRRRECAVEDLPEHGKDFYLSARNGEGVELPLFEDMDSPADQFMKRMPIQSSRYNFFAVSDSAVELNLYSGEKLLGTRALRFTDTSLTVMTW